MEHWSSDLGQGRLFSALACYLGLAPAPPSPATTSPTVTSKWSNCSQVEDNYQRPLPYAAPASSPSARSTRTRWGGVPGARAPLQVCKRRFGGYAWAGARRGAFAIDFVTSTASSGALDALNTFGANPRGARRAMHSEGGERRDPTPKTARERAQSPRRRARDVDTR